MKKFFCLLVLVVISTNFSFSQSSWESVQIATAIKKAEGINQMSGINNPDKIWPGQTVWVPILVERGDTEWGIFKEILFPPMAEPIPVITSNPPIPTPIIPGTEEEKESNNFWHNLFSLPWWLWLLIGMFVFGLASVILENKRKLDPVTAGPPQVPGGVNDEQAYSRMNEITQSRFPGARLNINNIRRGKLSGRATVHYASGLPKKMNLDNIVAYAGEIIVNSQLETIYFLQGCGNDVRQGDYMSGDELIFTPDAIIHQDGSESPQGSAVVEETKALKKTKEQITETTGTENFQIIMKILDIQKEAIKDGVHSTSTEYSLAGGLKTTTTYKTPQGQNKNEEGRKK